MTTATRLREIIAHLSCGIRQSLPSDDQIIIGHMRDALREASEALDELKHDPKVETIAPDTPLVSLPNPPWNWEVLHGPVQDASRDRAMHRAAVEAGYASLEDYVKIYGGEK
jgi:hypothetical protein